MGVLRDHRDRKKGVSIIRKQIELYIAALEKQDFSEATQPLCNVFVFHWAGYMHLFSNEEIERDLNLLFVETRKSILDTYYGFPKKGSIAEHIKSYLKAIEEYNWEEAMQIINNIFVLHCGAVMHMVPKEESERLLDQLCIDLRKSILDKIGKLQSIE